MSSTPEHVQTTVDDSIASTEVVLFMKGTKEQPRCGFSQRAVGLISQHCEEFQTVNVLDALPEYRAALAEHSGWETIPQVYVDGEFVGGSDILSELEERGDLASTLRTT
jgi:monothiol glutaredoxin